MPYQLYWRKGSATFVAEAALKMVAAEYELIEIPDRHDQRNEAFRAINPAGKIPVLITPEGQIVFETMAICSRLMSCTKTQTCSQLKKRRSERFHCNGWRFSQRRLILVL